MHREQDGRIPERVEALRRLPGVGRYTAGAVASFAFERPASLVDTNVARVLARLFAPSLNPRRARDLAQLWRLADELLPANGKTAWAHNQALMELGALVCTARVTYCPRCPLRGHCASASAVAPAPSNRARRGRTAAKVSNGRRGAARRDAAPSTSGKR